jgi:hypothetical protein
LPPGCYVKTPNGCPGQSWEALEWTRDSWGEKHKDADVKEENCTEVRRKDYDSWCGIEDAQMVFRSKEPTTCGCWIKTPHGCPKQEWEALDWVRDSWGEKHRNADDDKEACEARQKDYNTWCEIADAQIVFNKRAPHAPGCWVKTPTGCPKQNWEAKEWTQDAWGEEHRNAAGDKDACVVTRKSDYNTWCGVTDVEVEFVPQAPYEPGCYVKQPSSCPDQAWGDGEWHRDTWGEKNRNAANDKDKCVVTRKKEYDSWCGATDTVMQFRPEAPLTAGCYVLTPTGCAKQKNWSAMKWTRDTWGEKHRKAGTDKSACVDQRKADYNNWCGVENVQMVFQIA